MLVEPPEDTAPPDPARLCRREGLWTLTAASCDGKDFTAPWQGLFPITQLVIERAESGLCEVEFTRTDAGCTEVQAWRAELEPPRSLIEFRGTTSCEPATCSFSGLPERPCAVGGDVVRVNAAVSIPQGGRMVIGPLSPPSLAGLCTSITLTFERGAG